MPLLREAPTPSTLDRLRRDKHARDAIDKRLTQLEHDNERLLRSANACRQAIGWLPAGRDRELLDARADALGRDFETFRTLIAVRELAAA